MRVGGFLRSTGWTAIISSLLPPIPVRRGRRRSTLVQGRLCGHLSAADDLYLLSSPAERCIATQGEGDPGGRNCVWSCHLGSLPSPREVARLAGNDSNA